MPAVLPAVPAAAADGSSGRSLTLGGGSRRGETHTGEVPTAKRARENDEEDPMEEADPKQGKQRGKKHEKKQLAKRSDDTDKLLKLVAKLALKLSQEMTLVQAVVFDIIILESEGLEMKAMYEEGKKYGELTRGKSGHTYGPPHVWLFGALLTSLHKRGDQVGLKNKTKIGELLQIWELQEVEAKNEAVRACKTSKMYDREKRRLILGFGYLDREMRQAVLQGLEQIGGVRKFGRAPMGSLEKAIQAMID